MCDGFEQFTGAAERSPQVRSCWQ
jgi:hypothetical protein